MFKMKFLSLPLIFSFVIFISKLNNGIIIYLKQLFTDTVKILKSQLDVLVASSRFWKELNECRIIICTLRFNVIGFTDSYQRTILKTKMLR